MFLYAYLGLGSTFATIKYWTLKRRRGRTTKGSWSSWLLNHWGDHILCLYTYFDGKVREEGRYSSASAQTERGTGHPRPPSPYMVKKKKKIRFFLVDLKYLLLVLKDVFFLYLERFNYKIHWWYDYQPYCTVHYSLSSYRLVKWSVHCNKNSSWTITFLKLFEQCPGQHSDNSRWFWSFPPVCVWPLWCYVHL